MRALKRWWRRCYGEFRIRGRLREVLKQIRHDLGLPRTPRAIASGSRGHDSVYRLYVDATPVGVMRLLNPWKQRKTGPNSLPFQQIKNAERIRHEAKAYEAGHCAGLTPALLWHGTDALVSAYLPCHPVHDDLLAVPEKAWEMVTRATLDIARLHTAGLTHMDMSLANILIDKASDRLFFIDFEYGPAADVDLPTQKLYDYLRLVESSWKFIPPDLRNDFEGWFTVFEQCRSADIATGDLTRLLPALPNISNHAGFYDRLRHSLG